jgi:protein tyrosine phosphatase type 4A
MTQDINNSFLPKLKSIGSIDFNNTNEIHLNNKIDATLIEHKNLKFIVTGTPQINDLYEYVKIFETHNVKNIVRTCEEHYPAVYFKNLGFEVYELYYGDGLLPSKEILNKWTKIINECKDSVICIHCIAGLGRAPTLVAISLIDAGMDNLRAIQYIRSKIPNAFNTLQLNFIANYKSVKCQKCIIL